MIGMFVALGPLVAQIIRHVYWYRNKPFDYPQALILCSVVTVIASIVMSNL